MAQPATIAKSFLLTGRLYWLICPTIDDRRIMYRIGMIERRSPQFASPLIRELLSEFFTRDITCAGFTFRVEQL